MRTDILRKLPFLDNYYDRTIAPEDNVSQLRLIWRVGYDADFLRPSESFARVYTCLSFDRYESELLRDRPGLYCVE